MKRIIGFLSFYFIFLGLILKLVKLDNDFFFGIFLGLFDEDDECLK